jgi:hypothetical protein
MVAKRWIPDGLAARAGHADPLTIVISIIAPEATGVRVAKVEVSDCVRVLAGFRVRIRLTAGCLLLDAEQIHAIPLFTHLASAFVHAFRFITMVLGALLSFLAATEGTRHGLRPSRFRCVEE